MAVAIACAIALLLYLWRQYDLWRLPKDRSARIAALISRYESDGYLNGAILVAEHGRIIFEQGVGAANVATKEPNAPTTKFGIASISKQFTAALVLQEVAKGRLRMDDTVTQYLPWYRPDTGRKMTLEQLLRHTSGLPGDYSMPQFSATAEAAVPYEPQKFAVAFCQPNLSSVPGTKWEYSNCGYDLLGLILERESGKPFAELLREQILDPLGMNDTGLDTNGLVLSHRALGYERHAGPRYTPGPPFDRGHIFSAGALYSTVEDLFRWNQALSSDKLFPSEMRAQIFSPGMNNWAYGWFVDRIPAAEPGAGALRTQMWGDLPGNQFATMIRFPEQDTVIIVLRNVYASSERLDANLQAVVFDKQPRLPWRSPLDVAATAWYSAVGLFANRSALLLLAIVLMGGAGCGLWILFSRRRRTLAAVPPG